MQSAFFKMTIKSKPSIIFIQNFLNMFPIYWSNSDEKDYSLVKRPLSRGQSKSWYFSPMAKWPPAKICCWIFFFLVPQMTRNFCSIFLTCIVRFVGIFDLILRYLDIAKSFQTLHVHMNNAGTRGCKTVKLYNKKNFFFQICLWLWYMYIYVVPQWSSCHWELTSWPLNWDLVSCFHALAEGK